MPDKIYDVTEHLLDEIGGERLEGSGFEHEIPDPAFELPDSSSTNRNRQRSVKKEGHGDAE